VRYTVYYVKYMVCDTQYSAINTVNLNIRILKGEDWMNCDEIVSGLILEFRRGTLIMVVLAQLNKPMYGYSLVKELEGKGISIEGNTLYPLLRRLESQGLLKSEWETEATKPRKYYIITEDGKLVYKKIKEHWKKFSQSINVLMEEE